MINVDQFLNAQFTGQNATKRTPIPVGEYNAVIEDVVLEAFAGKKDPSKTYLRCTVTHNLDDAGLRAALKREKVTIFQDFLVDLTEAGSIDFSEDRNIKLGRLREAVGLNDPREPWGFPMFKGRPLRVKVGHEMYEGEPQSRVIATTKLS